MDNSLFYINFEIEDDLKNFINQVKIYSENSVNPVYVLKRPIIERKMDYPYDSAFVILIPKHKIMFFDYGNDADSFQNYVDDFVEDIGYVTKKYDFAEYIGRPRCWRDDLVVKFNKNDFNSFESIVYKTILQDIEMARKCEILVSLATGSINDAKRLGEDVPTDVLDQIKRKIVLFDGEQTRFVFNESDKERVTIQGLAGTGKTELLMHKIKELYTSSDNSKIAFTCHNEILADSLRKRIPEFFNFMKVEEQIKWNERLWVLRSWGLQRIPNSGLYSYICTYYNIPFKQYSPINTFDSICKSALSALEELQKEGNFECCFDYILIDEGQDFTENFFKLCEKVTKKCVYVAGDIFQDIFSERSLVEVKPDFLLNKCYRTDPRTLMGAHAIGMGLFEKKLRWLKDEEWEACGYSLTRENGFVELRRKPLKRFEDVDMNISNGIEIHRVVKPDYLDTILGIINRIRSNYPSVAPDDIGIIFMENDKENFDLANSLQVYIKQNFNWDVNIGYETKEKKSGTIFISNKNNVKGLEFPFVICLMRGNLTNKVKLRNSIYMMLTRSFLTSYLVLRSSNEFLDDIVEGIEFVNKNGYLKVAEPSDAEKEILYNAIINKDNVHKMHHELVDELLDKYGVNDKQLRKKLTDICNSYQNEDEEKLTEVIKANLTLLTQE